MNRREARSLLWRARDLRGEENTLRTNPWFFFPLSRALNRLPPETLRKKLLLGFKRASCMISSAPAEDVSRNPGTAIPLARKNNIRQNIPGIFILRHTPHFIRRLLRMTLSVVEWVISRFHPDRVFIDQTPAVIGRQGRQGGGQKKKNNEDQPEIFRETFMDQSQRYRAGPGNP